MSPLSGWATSNVFVALICKNGDSETFLTELLGGLNWLFHELQSSMQIVALIIGIPRYSSFASLVRSMGCNGKNHIKFTGSPLRKSVSF